MRTILLAALLGMGFSAAAPAAPDPGRSDPGPAEAVHAGKALAARLDAVIDTALSEERIVGAVVLVARNGEVVYRRAAGSADRETGSPMREDTVFRLSSVTKPVVSAAALALAERGAIALDAPVTRWLPEFRPKLPDGREPATAGLAHPGLPDGWGFTMAASILLDPAPTGTPQSPGTWQWGGIYGHSWFVDPARGLTVVAFTNTAIEGMAGRFPADVRNAVYGAP